MSNGAKKAILTVCVIILLIPLCFYVFIQLVFNYSFEQYTLKTAYGDKLYVEYDGYECESKVYASSAADTTLFTRGGKLSEKDITDSVHTDSLTLYNIDGVMIYDDGEGFTTFDDNSIDSHPEAAKEVKSMLFSSYDAFLQNMGYFLKSSTYKAEAEQIIEDFKAEKFDKLSDYGLAENVINDGCTVKNIKYEISHPRYLYRIG